MLYKYRPFPVYSRHMRPSIVHQEKSRTHCISVGSDGRSKDFLLIPNGSQPLSLHEYASLEHHWPTTKLVVLNIVTGNKVCHSFSSWSVRVNLLWSVISTIHEWCTWQFWFSTLNASWAPAPQSIENPQSPSWSLFLIVRSEIFTLSNAKLDEGQLSLLPL